MRYTGAAEFPSDCFESYAYEGKKHYDLKKIIFNEPFELFGQILFKRKVNVAVLLRLNLK